METQLDDIKRRIAALATKYAGVQKSLGLGDSAFAARHRQFLQSEKTWKGLKTGTWEGHIKADKALDRLEQMDRWFESARGFERDEYKETLRFSKLASANFERLLGSTKDRRGMVILAPEGVGKSWWASATVDKDIHHRFYVRVPMTCREKPLHLLQLIARRIGADIEKSPTGQFDRIIERLNSLREVVLFLDESHNGGVALMKILKDIIDETTTRIVYMAFPTEFDRVRSSNVSAMGEARQFLRRCLRPVFDDYRHGIVAADVVAYLASHGFKDNAELREAAAPLASALKCNYNLSTLADALTEARDAAEEDGVALTLNLVTESVRELCSNSEQRAAASRAAKEVEVEK